MSSGSDILSGILLRVAGLIDTLLSYSVSGNTLTDPSGVQLASSLSTIIQNMTTFCAQLSLLLLHGVNSL
jgi:hypothetical protein